MRGTFVQDGASGHTEKTIQKWCKENLPNCSQKDWWPANSPDLNPIQLKTYGASLPKLAQGRRQKARTSPKNATSCFCDHLITPSLLACKMCTILELHWCVQLRDKKKNCQVPTTAKQGISRLGKHQNGCEVYKIEKRSCKA